MTVTIQKALEYLSPDMPVILVGPPGIGKSDVAKQKYGDNLIIEHPVISQSVDYRGLPVANGDHADWLPMGNLRKICDKDLEPTVVLFDDVGQSTPSVQAALMQIIQARRLGDAEISQNVSFLLATNRASDKSGARPLLSALVNRALVVEVKASIEDWIEWALTQKNMNPLAIAYVKFRPDLFATEVPNDSMAAYCTPRSYARAATIKTNDVDILSGLIGKNMACDYLAYCDSASKLPNISDILAAPKMARAITDPGLVSALVIQAAYRAKDAYRQIFNLSENLCSPGWGVALVSAATSVFPDIIKTQEFKSWAVAHKSLLS